MFYLYLVILEGIVLLEAFIANFDGLLTRSQARQRYRGKKKVAVFMEHGGMWGDFFLVSPITSWILSHYSGQWKNSSIAYALIASAIGGSLMLNMWRKGSRHLDEPFARNLEVTLNGWVHYIYMIVCLTVILLFFFATLASATFVWVATIGLMIHVCLAILQPEYKTYGKVGLPNISVASLLIILLGVRAWYMIH